MRSILKIIEGILWISGLIIVGTILAEIGIQELQRNNAVAAFRVEQQPLQVVGADAGSGTAMLPEDAGFGLVGGADRSGEVGIAGFEPVEPDQSLWSASAIARYAASLAEPTSPVIGIFSIPRFDVELPVYDGATELHMDRGIARIDGTAMPGDGGNLGIAGHRDGYFRVLKDISFGDEIVVTGPQGPMSYVVEQLMIVDPSAVEVLDPTQRPSITLVTCYPFYFVGHAPERFIVRAVAKEQ